MVRLVEVEALAVAEAGLGDAVVARAGTVPSATTSMHRTMGLTGPRALPAIWAVAVGMRLRLDRLGTAQVEASEGTKSSLLARQVSKSWFAT